MLAEAKSEQQGSWQFVRESLPKHRATEAERFASEWGVAPIDVVRAKGWLTEAELARLTAQGHGVSLLDPRAAPPDARLFGLTDLRARLRAGAQPWRRQDGRTLFAAADPSAVPSEHLADIAVTTRPALLRATQEVLNEALVEQAIHGLAERMPEYAAKRGVPFSQAVAIMAAGSAVAAAFHLWPEPSFVVASIASSVFFLAALLFRMFLMIASFTQPKLKSLRSVSAAELPLYTILVALRDEAELLPQITQALGAINYPAAKLEILLLLEEDDKRTRAALGRLDLDARFQIITVPDRFPRTKPKACNYGLSFARGDYVVIYDAEDRPDPQQLLRALEVFRAYPDTDCVQARLSFYNASENWLTRQFAIEFSLWFCFLLPGLARLGLPVPLGGTSNHFKLSTLEKIGGWDAYNVTEDADVGIRLARHGGKVRVISSVTAEEANCALGNWLHQRSRWLKGYIQTWLVHMRSPSRLHKELGGAGFWTFHLIVGGAVLSAYLHLIFWSILIARELGYPVIGAALPEFLWPWMWGTLIAGNALAILCGVVAALHPQNKGTGRFALALNALFMPIYWFLISFAAIKALFSFALRPFYWAKTRHALSRFVKDA